MRRTSCGTPQVPFRHRMVAASTGALLTSLITNPLDVVKTRLQVQAAMQGSSVSAAAVPPAGVGCAGEWCVETVHGAHVYGPATPVAQHSSTPAPPPRGGGAYRGTLDALVKITRHEGAGGLYRGLGPSLLMAVPSTVLYYSLYDTLRAKFDSAGLGGVVAPLLSGSGARVCAAFVTAPLELIRTRAHTHHKDLSALRTMMKVVNSGGVAALWTGVGATLWRDVPFSALYWLGYEKGVQALGQSEADGSLAYMARAFTAGAGAGMAAAFVTTPFDVVKTRRQVTGGSGGLASSRLPEGMSTLRALGYLARQEGVGALLHGAMPRVLRIGPACAIMISSYEGGKHLYLRQTSR